MLSIQDISIYISKRLHDYSCLLPCWHRVSLCRQNRTRSGKNQGHLDSKPFDLCRTKAHLSGDQDTFIDIVYKHLVLPGIRFHQSKQTVRQWRLEVNPKQTVRQWRLEVNPKQTVRQWSLEVNPKQTVRQWSLEVNPKQTVRQWSLEVKSRTLWFPLTCQTPAPKRRRSGVDPGFPRGGATPKSGAPTYNLAIFLPNNCIIKNST